MNIWNAAILFLLIFISGFWLSRSGQPYNGLILTAHKLMAVAAVVLLVIRVIRINKVEGQGGQVFIALGITVLLFLAAIITGGLLSADNKIPAVISTVHKIIPYLAVVSTAVTLYILKRMS
jgi:hypothetical protein